MKIEKGKIRMNKFKLKLRRAFFFANYEVPVIKNCKFFFPDKRFMSSTLLKHSR